ncbi:MAG TPA: CoA-transferase [Chloroflexota bacterium]|nr:CoA-transferase [Chloroflexota bacterium]
MAEATERTTNKLVSLAEAAASVPDGAVLALGGFVVARCAAAFARELVRQRRRGLTVTQAIVGFDTDILAAGGAIARLVYGGGSLDHFGLVIAINRAIEQGRIIPEAYSTLTVSLRYLAGALGVPFMPTYSLLGTDVLARLEQVAPENVRRSTCPFTGEPLLLLRALQPDVAVVHVQQADVEGNARIYGPFWDNDEATKAARRVIVLAEEIVSTDYLRQQPELTLIPGFRVDMVVHVPYGAHPTSLYRYYDYDADHLREYVAAAKDPAALERYLDRYVYSVDDHFGYLERVGGVARLSRLRADPLRGY